MGCLVKEVKSAFLSGTHCETFAFMESLNQICKLLKHIFANKVWGQRNFPYRLLGTDDHTFLMAATLCVKPKQRKSSHTALRLSSPTPGHRKRVSQRGSNSEANTDSQKTERIRGGKWYGLMMFPKLSEGCQRNWKHHGGKGQLK